MNPQVTWDQMLAAYAAGDWDAIEKRATELLAWLDRDGMPPMVLKHPGLGSDFNRALAHAGCTFVLDIVRSNWTATPSGGPP